MRKERIGIEWIIEDIKATGARIYKKEPSPLFLREFVDGIEKFYSRKAIFPALTSAQKEHIAKCIVFRIKIFTVGSQKLALTA